MRGIGPSSDDRTGDAATGNVAGGVVLNTILTTLTDELDQVLVLMHLALDVPLAPLARDLQMERRELQARVDRIAAELEDPGLQARLHGIQRAGQIEHYYPIIARLGLQSWFCARPGCTNLISQSRTGRPRKTCSGRCRSRIRRANAVEQHGDELRPQSATSVPGLAIPDAAAVRTFVLQVMQPITYPRPLSYWSKANIHCRDRALLLLAFTGSVPVTVEDLCNLDVGDLGRSSAAFEIRLYRKRLNRATQYLAITDSDDPRLCATQALMSWRRVLARNGRTTGPLFTHLGRTGGFLKNNHRLGVDAVSAVIWHALETWGTEERIWRNKEFEFGKSTLLSDFLQEIAGDADIKRAVSRLGSVPDDPLPRDPCEARVGLREDARGASG